MAAIQNPEIEITFGGVTIVAKGDLLASSNLMDIDTSYNAFAVQGLNKVHVSIDSTGNAERSTEFVVQRDYDSQTEALQAMLALHQTLDNTTHGTLTIRAGDSQMVTWEAGLTSLRQSMIPAYDKTRVLYSYAFVVGAPQ